MTWSKVDYMKQLFIKLGYVLPEHRGRGIYSALWNAAVDKARELKYVQIVGATSPRNGRMQAIFEKQGRVLSCLTYKFDLPPMSAEKPTEASPAKVGS
jgi:GNAT superfamily N-acetyltransferase